VYQPEKEGREGGQRRRAKQRDAKKDEEAGAKKIDGEGAGIVMQMGEIRKTLTTDFRR
jgi:hypothetical protein